MTEDHIECPKCHGTGFIDASSMCAGDLVKRYRKAAGMTQAELAEKVFKSRPQISNIEAGRGDPTVSGLRKLAGALGVSVKDLVP